MLWEGREIQEADVLLDSGERTGFVPITMMIPEPEKERFPIQGGLTITWEAAERAYENYARRFGREQSLKRMAERGGFGIREYAWLWNGARDDEKGDLATGLRLSEGTLAQALVAGDVRKR